MITTEPAAYQVTGLTKRYRGKVVPANDDVNLIIGRGDFLGVLGPNGAGKSTLVKQLVGLLRPTSGSILLDGRDVVARPDLIPARVGYYGQQAAALRHHTPREVLCFTGCLRGLPKADARAQTTALLDRFRMGTNADRRLSRQSGGEQRLAVLLATFVGSPRILVLDEPTNELDPVRRRQFWEFLGDYARQHRATIILTTHNLAEAEDVIETVALIDRGRLVATGTLGELKRGLNDRVRLDLRLRHGAGTRITDAMITGRLTGIDDCRRVRDDRWQLIAPRSRAADLMASLIDIVGIDGIDDFRLITPTLEDLYLRLTEGRAEDAAR